MSLTHVLWDWNGTLLDDVDVVVDVMNCLLVAKGLPSLERSRYREIFGFPVQEYYARLGLGPEHGTFEEWARAFIDEYDRRARAIPVRPAARSILSRLNAAGLRQVVLSAARIGHIHELLALHDLAAYFDDVVALDDHRAHGKLEVALAWLARTGHDPAGLLVIGDTLHDHEVASALGAGCVLVAAGHHGEARLRGCGSAIIDDLDSLYTADTPLRAFLTAAPLP